MGGGGDGDGDGSLLDGPAEAPEGTDLTLLLVILPLP